MWYSRVFSIAELAALLRRRGGEGSRTHANAEFITLQTVRHSIMPIGYQIISGSEDCSSKSKRAKPKWI